MERPSRPEGMSKIDWLVALEEIKQLKARRDRYLDAFDWDAYEKLHAADHVSHHAPDVLNGVQAAPWTSHDEMMKNIQAGMAKSGMTIHHSYEPDIVFECPTKARGIWAVTAASVRREEDGKAAWRINFGYYHESYEMRDGSWMFTSRRWHRYIGTSSEGVIFPLESVRGSDAFVERDSFETPA